MGPGAAGGGEGGAHRWERESTLRGDVVEERAMGGAGFVRTTVLRAGRHGEPHQRAVPFVRRPGEHRDNAGQPDVAVSVGHGLHPGQRVKAAGPERNRAGRSAGIDDPNKLLKIGAQIRVTVRKVWVSMASSYPWQDLYRQVWANLRC